MSDVEAHTLNLPEGVSTEEAAEMLAAHRLVATTRRLMEAVATTDVDAHELVDAEQRLALVADALEERRQPRHRRIVFDTDAVARVQAGQPWEHFSFNPLGIPFVMTVQGPRAHGTLKLGALHAGPPCLLHGGFSAALMDAMLGSLVQAQGLRSVTAKLEVRYLRGVPLDSTVVLGAEIAESDGRKTWADGWIEHDGVRAVEARGLFVRMPGEPD